MSKQDEDTLYKVAYDEAARALGEQQTALESLRTRAGLCISASAVSTSFLGSEALTARPLNCLCWLAIAGFVGATVMSLAILWPRSWDSIVNPRTVIDTYVEGGRPLLPRDLHRDLALHMQIGHVETQEGLERLSVYFQIASGLVTVDVILWVVSLAPVS